MTYEEHKIKHIDLHNNLDMLLADFILQTGKRPSQTTILELLTTVGPIVNEFGVIFDDTVELATIIKLELTVVFTVELPINKLVVLIITLEPAAKAVELTTEVPIERVADVRFAVDVEFANLIIVELAIAFTVLLPKNTAVVFTVVYNSVKF